MKSPLSTLNSITFTPEISSVGLITSFSDGVVIANGLGKAMSGEMVQFENGQFGLALNLKKDQLGIITLADGKGIDAGQEVHTTGKILSIGVGDEIVGRTVDALGRPIDGKPQFKVTSQEAVEKIAPGVIDRKGVSVPLQTGIKAIDAMIPIGRGQRELIIGDRGTGKSSVALGTIINQKGKDVICVYVSIGQKRSFLAQTITLLEQKGAMDYSIIVSASASDPAAMQYLAPYAGVAIAEYFMNKGKDVLIVYDDLSKHAVAYREISLLLRRPSGREAYPGDVFYLHSRLLERACRLSDQKGGGSITALPIIETQANDVSAFIPTNVISITDGQIYLETDLFNSGIKPAINVGISVSRVGSSAQIKAMKQVAGSMKLDLAQFRELAAFSQFSSDLDPKTKAQIDRGDRLTELLKQPWENPMDVVDQVLVIWAGTRGYLDKVQKENIQKWEKGYLDYLHSHGNEVVSSIRKESKILEDIEVKIKALAIQFNETHSDLMIQEV